MDGIFKQFHPAKTSCAPQVCTAYFEKWVREPDLLWKYDLDILSAKLHLLLPLRKSVSGYRDKCITPSFVKRAMELSVHKDLAKVTDLCLGSMTEPSGVIAWLTYWIVISVCSSQKENLRRFTAYIYIAYLRIQVYNLKLKLSRSNSIHRVSIMWLLPSKHLCFLLKAVPIGYIFCTWNPWPILQL